MARIHQLPKNVSDKIAAGEVVERPLSVVKELVENSIDAGSTKITIEIKAGGKDYIRVTDNGWGINPDETEIAFSRYATSKILEESDLESIGSLGFRGEALASISSVCCLKMITKTKSSKFGTEIELEGGKVVSKSKVGSEDGTTIIIKKLFYNVPARKKFLKTDKTEGSLIVDFVSKIAIAYPEIQIRLVSNEKILFSTPGNGNLKSTILNVFGTELSEDLLPIYDRIGKNDINITGYIGKPSSAKNTRKMQVFFVDGRLIKSKIIENAISEAYKDKIFSGKFPIVFLLLKIDTSKIDINVSPSKTEIKFWNDEQIFEHIKNVLRVSLLNEEANSVNNWRKLTYVNNSQKIEEISTGENDLFKYNLTDKSLLVNEGKNDSNCIEDVPLKEQEFVLTNTVNIEGENDNFFTNLRTEIISGQNCGAQLEISSDQTTSSKLNFSSLDYIGSVFNTYIILKSDDGCIFLDQHAAHERILYEKLMKRFNSKHSESQMLLIPLIITLSPAVKELSFNYFNALSLLGFSIDDFGNNNLIIKEVPSCMELSEAEDFIRGFFDDDLIKSPNFLQNFDLKKKEIIANSCKAAIKAGDKISEEETLSLLSQLDLCENPYSCPHGRPTYIKFSKYELERLFKRK